MKKLLTLTGMALMLAACSGNSAGEKHARSLHGNLTPELLTLTERPIDVQNRMWLTHNTNSRMFWEDMGRVFYTNRPSRLTFEPVPY